MSKQLTFIKDPAEIVGVKRAPRVHKKKADEPQVFDCNTCGLAKSCQNPKISRFGRGRKGILIVNSYPDKTEDKTGVPLVGATGNLLAEMLKLVDIDMNEDCIRTNVVRCFPGKEGYKDIKPTGIQVRCCQPHLELDITEVKPKLIICVGTEAIQAVLKSDAIKSPNAMTLHGKVIPYHKLGCWVGCLLSPSYFLHRKNDDNGLDDKLILAYDLANIVGTLDLPLPKIPSKDGNVLIRSDDEAVKVLDGYCRSEKTVGFDYETTTLRPDDDGADILCVSITDSEDHCHFIPIAATDGIMGRKVFGLQEQAMVLAALGRFIRSDAPKTVQNYYMEEMWSRKFVGSGMNNFVHDTMVSYHIVNYSCKNCTSLEFQAFERTGHEYKHEGGLDRANLIQTPLEDVCNYNCFDSRHTVASCHQQREVLDRNPRMKELNDLFTRSLHTLANIHERGIRIDTKRMDQVFDEYTRDMATCTEKIRQHPEVKKFEAKRDITFNPNSPPQWESLLYGTFKVEKTKERTTKGGSGSTDADVLEEIRNTTDNPEVKKILKILKQYRDAEDVTKKIKEYRRLIRSDGKIHPVFWLNTADTFRSSASGPNSQNAYKHDPDKKKFRRIIIPEPGQILLEVDFKAHEARVIGMASGDVNLIDQTVKKIDIHKKWGGKIFSKPIDKVDADMKYAGKNKFVFPSIYGAEPRALCGYFGHKFPIEHFQKLQTEFWNEFPGVRQWQKDNVKFYCENGYIEGLSGFRVHGPLTIYQIYNFPIQGSGFHLLLDAIVRIDDYMIEHHMKSSIINEVHDSIVFSVEPIEFDDVLELATSVMKSKRFSWQTVPLDVDAEMGENWYDLQPVK